MKLKNTRNLAFYILCFAGLFIGSAITSCGGKAGGASALGTNVQYEILNLSPDLGGVDLFINFNQVNTTPFTYSISQNYFYVPFVTPPYQIRQASTTGVPKLSLSDSLRAGSKYTLFITGSVGDNSLTTIFTVDTATQATIGHGKVRFVDASPSGTGGLDVYANGTLAFKMINYTNYSPFIELPVGNYDFQVTATGSTTVLKDLPGITIQDDRLYTLYAYGYTSRIDTAAFNAAVITNR